MLLMSGGDGDDALFLQIKEADASVLEPYWGKSTYANHGERVVQGQRLMQHASDIFLGWTHGEQVDLYVRQLRDMKLSEDITTMTKSEFDQYAQWCAMALARAHARCGDPAQISGYLATAICLTRRLLCLQRRTLIKPNAIIRPCRRLSKKVESRLRLMCDSSRLAILL